MISACAENPSHLNTTYLDRYADPNPTLTSILECHGFSCSEVLIACEAPADNASAIATAIAIAMAIAIHYESRAL